MGIKRIFGGPGIRVLDDGTNVTISSDAHATASVAVCGQPRYAKVTATSTVSGKIRHTLELGYWNGATDTTTGGTWTPITMTGTCYGFTHNSGSIATGQYVSITFDYIDPSTGNLYFTITASGADDIGTDQYQVRMMLTDTTAGWDYPRAVPL